MNKYAEILFLCVIVTGCTAPSVVSGNSRSVVIDDGQYTNLTNADLSEIKAEADKWCAQFDRVSSVKIRSYGHQLAFTSGSRTEYACVEK